MTIRERLKTIGQAWKTTSIEEKVEEKAVSIVTNLFDNLTNKLSDEKSVSAKLLSANREWVYRNNDVIAKEVASIEFELFTSRVSNGQVVLDRIYQHPVLDALDRFNGDTTKSDGIYITQSHKKLAGDSFWLLTSPNDINNMQIFTLDPTKMKINLGKFQKTGGQVVDSYEYTVKSDGKPQTVIYKPKDIIQFKSPNPENPYRGLGAVEAAASTIDLDNLTVETNKEFFNRGAITNFVLSTDQKMTDDQKKRLRAELRANYSGIKNAFRTMLLTGGIKPESIQMSNKDMEMLAQSEWYRDKIMVIFGNTKASLGITDDVNYANGKNSIALWKTATVRADMTAIVNTLNEFFVPKFGTNLILGFKDPVGEDRTAKVEEAVQLSNAKIITKNEARELVGYDGVVGGDEFESQEVRITDPSDQEQLPKSLRYINYERVFRKQAIYTKLQESYEIRKKAKEVAKDYLTSKRTKKEEPKPISVTSFSDKQVESYYFKLMRIVDVIEPRFKNIAEQFINENVDIALAKIDDPEARKSGELLNIKERKQVALNKFTPVLTEALIASGNEGNALLDLDTPYLPQTKAVDVREEIRKQILLFAGSMLETDIATMTEVIARGLEAGSGVDVIRREIQAKFADYSKTQAEKVARTEVIKTSNLGLQDSFLQSGIVEGKEWLAELDGRTDSECESMSGKIVSIDDNYDNDLKSALGTDKANQVLSYGGSMEYPPLHPNCRCTIIPVVVGNKAFKRDKIRELEAKIENLEAQIDKRTKQYKVLKQKNLEKTEYVAELEKMLEV